MKVMLEVYLDFQGTRDEFKEVFSETMREVVRQIPGALLKGFSWELEPGGRKNLAVLRLPVLSEKLDEAKAAIGPTWRRIAHQRRNLSERVVRRMREAGEIAGED